jgi:hypothetical protein
MTRKEAKDTKGVSRVSWISSLSWFSCFRVPRHHRQPHPGAGSRNQCFLRRGHVTGQALVAQLLRIVRDYNLEEAHRAMEDRAEEAPLIPRIICSEALI